MTQNAIEKAPRSAEEIIKEGPSHQIVELRVGKGIIPPGPAAHIACDFTIKDTGTDDQLTALLGEERVTPLEDVEGLPVLFLDSA